jgi:hypothetical protein
VVERMNMALAGTARKRQHKDRIGPSSPFHSPAAIRARP